jgi:poly(3-hydroxybutyrate) depolymerase
MCECAEPNTGRNGRQTVFGGDAVHNTCTLVVPNAFDSRLTYPLALLLHPAGVTSETDVFTRIKIERLPNNHNGVFCIGPVGAEFADDSTSWNSGPPMQRNPGDEDIDDVGYLSSLVESVIGSWPIDLNNVWVIGISAGAFMAQRLAAERPDLFTACVAVHGHFSYLDGDNFAPLASPVHVLQVAAASDTTVPYAGDPTGVNVTDYPAGAWPGAEESLAIWSTLNGGGTKPETADSTMDLNNVASTETEQYIYTGTVPNGSLELWKGVGVGHNPAWAAAMGTSVMAWLRAHPRVP